MVLVFFRHQFFDLDFKPHSIRDVTKSSTSESSSETDSETNVEINSITTKVTTVDINPVPESEVIEIPLDDEIPPPPSNVVGESKIKNSIVTPNEIVIKPKILQRAESNV